MNQSNSTIFLSACRKGRGSEPTRNLACSACCSEGSILTSTSQWVLPRLVNATLAASPYNDCRRCLRTTNYYEHVQYNYNIYIYIYIHCIVLYCIVLYSIVFYCIVLYCIILYCIVLYCIAIYCIILNYIIVYYIILYCIILYYIIWYYMILYDLSYIMLYDLLCTETGVERGSLARGSCNSEKSQLTVPPKGDPEKWSLFTDLNVT